MDAHEELLTEWSQRKHHQGHCFIKDGIIDSTRWKSASPRVLFLLKEARHEGSSWDLREFIRESGPKSPTFWNAAYWCYAIHHIALGQVPRFPIEKQSKDEAAELFRSSAVVNIKKSGGTVQSVHDDLERYGQQDGSYIKKQIDLIDPQIVICGYTWCYVKHLWPDAQDGGYDLVLRVGGRVFIDFWHPASYQKSLEQLKYYALTCLLQNSHVLSKLALAGRNPG